jgi:hypothetical protein
VNAATKKNFFILVYYDRNKNLVNGDEIFSKAQGKHIMQSR